MQLFDLHNSDGIIIFTQNKVINGNNLVVISPRRMGKTGLIQFCYDKPELSRERTAHDAGDVFVIGKAFLS